MEPRTFITYHVRTDYCRHIRYIYFGRLNYYMYDIYIIGLHWSEYMRGIALSGRTGHSHWTGFALWIRYANWGKYALWVEHSDSANRADYDREQARRLSPPPCWRRKGFLRPADASSLELWWS